MKSILSCGVLACLLPLAGLASQPVTTTSGTVTLPALGDTVSIDGQNYRIPPSERNRSVMPKLKTGDVVDLQLRPSTTGKGMEVISITPHDMDRKP